MAPYRIRIVPPQPKCIRERSQAERSHLAVSIERTCMPDMPNLYFCQSVNRSLGILRAVLSWEEGRSLLNHHSVHYVGEQFPTASQERPADFAVLRIFDEEPDEEWRAGFCRFDADLMRIDETVQACTAKPPEAGAAQAKRRSRTVSGQKQIS